MATFKHIKIAHVLSALKEIDRFTEDELYNSTGYDLLLEGRRYPPKEVLRFADEIAGQRNFNDFSGGKITNDPLIKLGFNIVLKDTNISIPLGYSRNNILDDTQNMVNKNDAMPMLHAYLLTWNAENWTWSDLDECINQLNETGKFVGRWSCGNTKRIEIGDRVFIIKLGKEPRGVFASGRATSKCYYDVHWDRKRAKNGETALYIDVDFEIILNYAKEPILPRQLLDEDTLSKVNWSSMSSGISISDEVLPHLEEIWSAFLKKNNKTKITTKLDVIIPEEVMNAGDYVEGAVTQININKYERNANARKKCIDHFGAKCIACGFDFGDFYGQVGYGFIQVHHLVPLHSIRKTYKLNPIKDLRPVCANCHAIIHKHKPELSIEELIAIISSTEIDRS